MSRWETLQYLRAKVSRIGRGGLAEGREDEALPLGVAEIDEALEEGGLRRGALHEVSGTAATGFAVVIAGRAAWAGQPVLWCGVGRGRGGLYPPGLAMLGLPPSSLLLMDCRNERELLAAAEEGLRGGDLAALLLEVSRLPDMTAARRLQLAAETGGSLGLMLCPGAMTPDGVVDALPPSPAVSRWWVGHVPAGEQGYFRWRLELLRCRGGGNGEWMVDWNEKTLRLDLVSAAGN